MSKVFVTGVARGQDPQRTKKAIAEVFLKASNDLSWLKKGDLVLLKPALNSPDPYPSTTDPLAVEAVAELIKERGGQVVVGDQSGIEHVIQTERGVFRGDSADNFLKSGMGRPGQHEFAAFEKGDWNGGFYNFKPEDGSQWPDGFWVTEWIRRADHIVNLPRLSTHSQAGVTLGFKNLVGLLREDSRMEFHASGPMSVFPRLYAAGSGLKTGYGRQGDFWRKVTEISLAVRDRMRLTLFSGTRAQLTFGPDRKTVGVFSAKAVEPETGLVFASADPVAAEATAIAFMSFLYGQLPLSARMLQKLLVAMNGKIGDLGRQPVWDNPFLRHALDLGLGERAVDLDMTDVPEGLVGEIGGRLGRLP
ncbi:DUF362 domain-containing protein [Candidatus Uhrbacteria bacterium]|nr:DUF362 domain-containing protein [Candidatus Uhrbacteria bacterium]